MIDLSALKEKLNGKGVAVFGLNRSGMATLQALRAAGIPCVAGDDDAEQRARAASAGFAVFTPQDEGIWARIDLLVLNPGVPLYAPAPHDVVLSAQNHRVEIIGDIELFHRAQPSIKTIGVTGTNGKSTTTALITHIINACGQRAIATGNIGAAIMAQDIGPHDIAVIEMSSWQLDLCPHFRPDIAIHTNLTPDHLDRHGTIERYIAAKEKIFDGNGFGICGVDDDYSQNMFTRAQTNIYRTMTPISCLEALNDGISLSGTDISDTFFSGGIVGSLQGLPHLRGIHNFQNALMAYAACRALGFSVDQVCAALGTYPGLPHRQFLVRTIGLVDYINDSKATNADATDKALKTYQNIYWIAGGLPKSGGLSGLEKHAEKIKKVYLIGTAAHDFTTWCAAQNIPHVISGTLQDAVAAAHHDAQQTKKPGTVLLSPACASYDQFHSFEHRGDVFTQLVANLTEAEAA